MQHFDYKVSLRIQNAEGYILVREIYSIPFISFIHTCQRLMTQKEREKKTSVLYIPPKSLQH